MPQPLNLGYVIHTRPNLVAEFPEHAIGIALVATEWAALERNLIEAFTFCLFALSRTDRVGGDIALRAWISVDSLKARLGLLQNVAEGRVPEGLLAEFTSKVIPEIRKRASERNRVVHGVWGFTTQHPGELVLDTVKPEDRMRYSAGDFRDIATRIIDTSDVIATYWMRVREALYPRPPSLTPRPPGA